MVSKYFLAGFKYELGKQAMEKQALIPELLLGLGSAGALGDALMNKGQGLSSLFNAFKSAPLPNLPKGGPSVLDYQKGFAGHMGEGMGGAMSALNVPSHFSPTGEMTKNVADVGSNVPSVYSLGKGVANTLGKIPGVTPAAKFVASHVPGIQSAVSTLGKIPALPAMKFMAKGVGPLQGATMALDPGTLEYYGKMTGMAPEDMRLKTMLGGTGALVGAAGPVGNIGTSVASTGTDIAKYFMNRRAGLQAEQGNQLGQSYDILNKMQRDPELDPNALKAWLSLNPNYKEQYKFSPAIVQAIEGLRNKTRM